MFFLLVLGLVVTRTRRRSEDRRGPSSGADVAALQRVRDVQVESRAPEPPVETAPAEPPAEVRPPPVEVARPALRERLARSRRFLGARLAEAFTGASTEEAWEDLEAGLIQADVGVETSAQIVEDLRRQAQSRGVKDVDEVRALLTEEIVGLLDSGRDRGLTFANQGVTVWLVVGVNGTGKTTTIGKLAADLRMHGRNVALAAADTFRAAADEQLEVWAGRTGAEIVRHQPGADPGAVAFDAHKHARARGVDVLIVDTAGRLHTKTPLMDELAKVRRVIEREGPVNEVLLVLDASAGQNGLVQARQFADALGVTGIVLTKLDGTAKGGIAIAIEKTLGIPIKLVGVGEGVGDVEPFDPKTYADALLG